MKTNGARFLESLGIAFELREYEVDPERPDRDHGGQEDRHAARAGFQNAADNPGGPDDYVFAVIPGDAELDFKKLARAAGWRKAEMVPLKDVQPLTGYIRGGVTDLRREEGLSGLRRRDGDSLRQDQRLGRNPRNAVDPEPRRLSARGCRPSASRSKPPT